MLHQNKKHILSMVVLTFSSLSAENFIPSYESNYNTCYSNCYEPSNSNWGNLSARGEFLYWQPTITGMSFALTRTNVDVPFGPFGPGIVPNNLSIQNVDFNYGPGYRIGVRYTLPNRGFDLDVEYTDFTKSNQESVQAGNEKFIDTLWDALSAINAATASANLKVELQSVYAAIGKTLLFGDFSMRPNFGLQYSKLDCHEHIQYTGITTINSVPFDSLADVELGNETEGWGLAAGIDAYWNLFWDFELFGKAKYAVLRTKFISSQNQQTFVDTQDSLFLTSSSQFKGFNQNVEVLIGLGWNQVFNSCKCPITLNLYVGYEISAWFQNIQLTRVLSLGTGFSDANTTNIGNVGFRGLTTGASLSF